MRRTRALQLLLLSCLGMGCKHAGDRLEGHWHGVRAEGVPPDEQAAANTFAVGTELDFKTGTLRVKTPRDEQAGKYKVTSEDKGQVSLTTDRDGPADVQTFTLPDDHTLRWQIEVGKALIFQKD